MSYVDVAEIKQQLSIEQVIHHLNLTVTEHGAQLRGPCPYCDSEDQRLFVATKRGGKDLSGLFYVFCQCKTKFKKGGDLVHLYATVKDIPFKQAIEELNKLSESPPETANGNSPEGFEERNYLIFDSPALQVLGFEPDVAEKLGIGLAPKGPMKDRLMVPIRLPDGKLVGYIGINDCVVPKQWHF